MIRKIIRITLFLIAMTTTIYGATQIWPIALKSDNVQLAQKVIQNIGPSNEKSSPPEWTVDEIFLKINSYRTENKLATLNLNEKLSSAAKSRLAIINQYNDYDGSETGLTRDKALVSVGYPYSVVGDLVIVDFFRTNDPIKYWESIDVSRETLKNKNLLEVGIAMVQENDMISLYVLLASPQKKVTSSPKNVQSTSWGGPDLWEAVNKRRVEYGVNPLNKLDDLCTIAAIRLNQILNKGKLDDHEGFIPTLNRDDLKRISEKYNISEFLVAGYSTVGESIKAWENTLGHKKLLSGGEYVWGCVYAQNGYGVAIAAY